MKLEVPEKLEREVARRTEDLRSGWNLAAFHKNSGAENCGQYSQLDAKACKGAKFNSAHYVLLFLSLTVCAHCILVLYVHFSTVCLYFI